MIIEALTPFTVKTKTLGHVSLEPGDRLTWPDGAVRMLLDKFPEKIRVIEESSYSPFRIGQHVNYQIPIIRYATRYSWESHTGTIADIDFHNERLTIIPMDENQPWRIVARCYCQPVEDTHENEDGD